MMGSVNLLQRSFGRYSQQQQLNILRRIERFIDDLGPFLYEAGWNSDRCGLEGQNDNAPCGDKANGAPVCPVPPP